MVTERGNWSVAIAIAAVGVTTFPGETLDSRTNVGADFAMDAAFAAGMDAADGVAVADGTVGVVLADGPLLLDRDT